MSNADNIKGWTLVLHTHRTKLLAGKKWFLKKTEGMTPTNYVTTDRPAEAKLFESEEEATAFRARIYIAEPGNYPEGWGWAVEPRMMFFYEFLALNANGSEIGKWSGYLFEGAPDDRDKITESAEKTARAILKNHPKAWRIVFYEEGNEFDTRYELSYQATFRKV